MESGGVETEAIMYKFLLYYKKLIFAIVFRTDAQPLSGYVTG